MLSTNAKLMKSGGAAADYLVAGLTLAPHGISGYQVCPEHSRGCAAACLAHWAGQRVTPQARRAAIRLARLYFEHRSEFIEELHEDIGRHVVRAARKGLQPLVRLNVGSDLDWCEVIRNWPSVQFYDYTKVRSRFERYIGGHLPSNYALTFSRHEKHHPATIARYLRNGGNVAQVFDVEWYPQGGRAGKLPESVELYGQRFPVVCGDEHDVRLPAVDGAGVIVGLRLKGTNAAKQRARATGFARKLESEVLR